MPDKMHVHCTWATGPEARWQANPNVFAFIIGESESLFKLFLIMKHLKVLIEMFC